MNNLQNVDAERAVVASILFGPSETAKIMDRVSKCGVTGVA